jgi:hypothetical protein
MSLNVTKELAALGRLGISDLRQRYREVIGAPTTSGNRTYLTRRILWRLQSQVEGSLSDRARQRALEMANEADLRTSVPRPLPGQEIAQATHTGNLAPIKRPRRLPMPGTVLTRHYKGQTVQVMVKPDGFEYEGEMYKSLSAIAKKITGSHWNGFSFFGVDAKTKTQGEP